MNPYEWWLKWYKIWMDLCFEVQSFRAYNREQREEEEILKNY